MCYYMVKVVRRSIRRRSYGFELNAESWEGLCNSSQMGEDVVLVKCVPMRKFMVCVGCILCGGQDRYIASFSDQNMDYQKEVYTLVIT